MQVFKDILPFFVLTVSLEGFMLLFFKEKIGKCYLYSLGINAITNIPLNIFFLSFHFSSMFSYFMVLFVFEAVIWSIESVGYIFLLKSEKEGIKYGVCCNAFSLIIGILIQLV